jgi:hypothetical protein
MGKWHRCINHLRALLLVEIGGAGVKHHGLDGEVPGVLLPVALLRHPLLDLHLPYNTHNHHTREQRTHVPGTCPKWNNDRETQRADLIHSVGDQRAVSPASYHWWNQQLRRRRPSGQVRAFVPLNQVRTRGEMFWRGWLQGLRSLDGEADAGEAARPAVEGAAARLHPLPDRGGRGWEEGRQD